MVADEETLFRCVSGDPAKGHFARADDRLVVSSSAFLDPSFQPSVDRAHLRDDDASKTKRHEKDGVCKLVAVRVRGIDPQEVGDLDQKGHVLQQRNVDVVPDEIRPDNLKGLPPNPAHALVVTSPQITKTGGPWGRVRAALARVATETGWAIEPS
jgi:hypothetical protein